MLRRSLSAVEVTAGWLFGQSLRPAHYVSMLLILSSIACAGSNLKSGESKELTANGEVVGSVRQISPTEQEFTYDKNRDDRPEYRWTTENTQFKVFEKFDPATGKLRSRSHYLRGALNRIEVFGTDGSIRGIVNYPGGGDARSVELPKKKKLVEFINR